MTLDARPATASRCRGAACRTARAPLAAALALLAGCQGTEATRASYVEQAVALAPEIERETGLRFKSPPKVEVRTQEQVRAFLTRSLEEPRAAAELAGQQAVYRRLGLIPDTMDLRALLLRVLEEQVVGYYDPPSKTLYVVQGADSAAAAVTLRHELVHALQDQHRNLDSVLNLRGQADRSTAAQAALEGQATWVQLAGGMAAAAPGSWERVRQDIRANMNRTPALAEAPFIVQETLLFPYLSGAELARRVALAGHRDSVLLRFPVSTEQVLHPERWQTDSAANRPLTVTLPPPTGGAVAAENTLGEFETRMLLYHHLQDLGTAARAAAGWGGDRWATLTTPGGEAFVWVTAWDGALDAGEFYDAMTQLVTRRYPGAREAAVPAPAPAAPARRGGRATAQPPAAASTASTVRAFTAATERGPRAVLVRATEVGGRPIVVYVDAPAATGTALVDPARVTVAP